MFGKCVFARMNVKQVTLIDIVEPRDCFVVELEPRLFTVPMASASTRSKDVRAVVNVCHVMAAVGAIAAMQQDGL